MIARNYPIRYYLERGDFTPPPDTEEVANGVSTTTGNFGYTDDLFIASIIRNKEGQIASILMLDSINGPRLTREILEAVQNQIKHFIEHHLED